MGKNKNNEEIQSRREFFKKAAKGALPILGAVVLTSTPILVQAKDVVESSGCNDYCEGSCRGGCDRSCSITCDTTCRGACDGSCSGTCDTTCYQACDSSCRGGCEGDCRGGCRGDCTSSNY